MTINSFSSSGNSLLIGGLFHSNDNPNSSKYYENVVLFTQGTLHPLSNGGLDGVVNVIDSDEHGGFISPHFWKKKIKKKLKKKDFILEEISQEHQKVLSL